MAGGRIPPTIVKIAAIDIGTNTVLLLIAEVDGAGTIHPLHHEEHYPRLGKDVDRSGRISASAFDRIARILQKYLDTARQFGVDCTVAAATSAVRDARNQYEFLSYLKHITHFDVSVISGEDEALLTFRGAVSGFPMLLSPAVIDIGGGSTEISFRSEATKVIVQRSIQIGSVRLSERFFGHNPPTQAEIADAVGYIEAQLRSLPEGSYKGHNLIGVAGTVTTLACLDQGLKEFDDQKVSGYKLRTDRVAHWSQRLLSMSTGEIRALSKTTEGRADILPAGVLILYESMKGFDAPQILVSERGLRYGLALKLAEEEKKRSD